MKKQPIIPEKSLSDEELREAFVREIASRPVSPGAMAAVYSQTPVDQRPELRREILKHTPKKILLRMTRTLDALDRAKQQPNKPS